MKNSDLAIEFSKKLLSKRDYIKTETKINKNITSTMIDVKSDSAKNKLGREKGLYALLTIPFNPILQSVEKNNIIKQLKLMLQQILFADGISKPKSVLVVGLGNPKLTADKFGVQVVNNILTTRHAFLSGMEQKNMCAVSKLSTNVFGMTGLESYDIVKGVVDNIKPELVIIIDTLVASTQKRLCTNIQIANVGVVPGSGVENTRKELSKTTLGVNVITVGVPFVLFASDLVEQEMKKYCKEFKSRSLKNLVIMPKEIDEQLNFCSKVIAKAINEVLNPDFDEKDIETFFM